MRRYIKSGVTSGYVGIWWYTDDTVIGRLVSLDNGYNDGRYVHYSETKNHSTEWKSVLQEQLPEKYDELYPKMYKCIERGRVVYNIVSQCYQIFCSEDAAKNAELISAVVEFYKLRNCRYEVCTDTHYHVFELTGNPAIDNMEYGLY